MQPLPAGGGLIQALGHQATRFQVQWLALAVRKVEHLFSGVSLRLAVPNILVIGYLRWTVLWRALQDSAHSAWLSIIWVAQA